MKLKLLAPFAIAFSLASCTTEPMSDDNWVENAIQSEDTNRVLQEEFRNGELLELSEVRNLRDHYNRNTQPNRVSMYFSPESKPDYYCTFVEMSHQTIHKRESQSATEGRCVSKEHTIRFIMSIYAAASEPI